MNAAVSGINKLASVEVNWSTLPPIGSETGGEGHPPAWWQFLWGYLCTRAEGTLAGRAVREVVRELVRGEAGLGRLELATS